MPLNSKYKDSDGDHPDGIYPLSKFQTQSVDVACNLGDSEALDNFELDGIHRAAMRDMKMETTAA